MRVRGHIELAEWRPSHAQWGEACPGYIQMGTVSTRAAKFSREKGLTRAFSWFMKLLRH